MKAWIANPTLPVRTHGIRAMRLGVPCIVALLLAAPAVHAEPACELAAPASATLAVERFSDDVRLAAVPAGANALYFSEDDAYWKAGNATASLRAAGINSLRFPGGEVADNYDWSRNRLVRPSGWPGEKGGPDVLDSRTDFREFLGHAAKVGARDLYFVVNVDSAIEQAGSRDGNLKAYAAKAAAWVDAVKRAGFAGQYWEIGNEPNLAAGFPLSVSEYAAAVREYSRAMRAVDPSIRIGAAGPRGADVIGFADKLTAKQLEAFRAGGGLARVCGKGAAIGACVKTLARKHPGKGANAAWWPTLIELAGDSFDFAVVHSYDSTDLVAGSSAALLETSTLFRQFGADLAALAGHDLPLAVTEWNTAPTRADKAVPAIEHALDISVRYGNFMLAGVSRLHYWPLQERGKAYPAMLDNAGKPLPPARVFRLYGDLAAGDSLAQAVPDKGIYVLRARRDAGTTHVLVNASNTARRVRLGAAIAGTLPAVDGLLGDRSGGVSDYAACTAKPDDQGRVVVPLPARAIIRVRQLPAGDTASRDARAPGS